MFRDLLGISFMMSFGIVLLLLLSPSIVKRYGAKISSFLWLSMTIRFALPFQVSLPVFLVKVPDITASPLFEPTADMIRLVNDATSADAVVASEFNFMSIPSYFEAFRFVWFAGMVILALYNILIYIQFTRRMDRCSFPLDVSQKLDELKAELGIQKIISIKVCPLLHSPVLFRLFKPTIYLPQILEDNQTMDYVLKHELTHYKQKHLWYKCLGLLVSIIHWFNPMVYVLRKQIDLVCELVCDEEVVANLDKDQRRQYGEAIISLMRQSIMPLTSISTYFNSGNKTLKRRFNTIMDTTSKKRGLGIAVAASLILVLTVIIIAGVSQNDGSNTGFTFGVGQFEKEMKLKGYNTDIKNASMDFLSTTRKILTIGDEMISIYLYPDNTSMEKDAINISDDGFGYSRGNSHTQAGWISPPHFFKRGKIIVQYVGKNENIISDLENILGEPFAGVNLY